MWFIIYYHSTICKSLLFSECYQLANFPFWTLCISSVLFLLLILHVFNDDMLIRFAVHKQQRNPKEHFHTKNHSQTTTSTRSHIDFFCSVLTFLCSVFFFLLVFIIFCLWLCFLSNYNESMKIVDVSIRIFKFVVLTLPIFGHLCVFLQFLQLHVPILLRHVVKVHRAHHLYFSIDHQRWLVLLN